MADREDFLLAMEHDAAHAVHSVGMSYLWYGWALLLIAWNAKEDIMSLSLNLWLYAHELQAFLVTGVFVIPIFLAYAAWQLVNWARLYLNHADPDGRVSDARALFRTGLRHFAIAVIIYAATVLTPVILRGFNVMSL